MKEWSRQISELNQKDFSLLHTAADPLGSTCDVSIATSVEGAVCEQLCSLVERLRSSEVNTSDSGAVSDYSENTECKSHSVTSLDCSLSFEENESYQRDSKVVQGADDKDASSEEFISYTDTEVNIEIQEQLSQSNEKQMPVIENTLSELDSNQPPSITNLDCDESTDEHSQSLTDSTKENGSEQMDEVAKETGKNKRETAAVSGEQFRIRRKTKRYYGHGYSNWRRGNGCYDNSRSGRNGYYDNGRNKDQQPTSSSRDHKVQNQSSFNHQEVAQFLWNSKT